MNYIAKRFATWFVQHGARAEDEEIYAYAMECLLNTTLTFMVILLIGGIVHRLVPAVIWMVFFLCIRHFSGGLHAPNHIACFLFSVAIGTACMFLTPLLNGQAWLIYSGVAVSILIIFAFAPIIHSSHPLSEAKVRRMKKTARVMILIESCFILCLHIILQTELAYAAVLGILSATISTLIGRIHAQ